MLSTQDKDVQATIEATIGADVFKIVANEPLYFCQKLSLLQVNILFPDGKLEKQTLNDFDCMVYTSGKINFLICYESDWDVSKYYEVKLINLNTDAVIDRRPAKVTSTYPSHEQTRPHLPLALPLAKEQETAVQKAIREATARTRTKDYGSTNKADKKWLTPVDMFHYAVSYSDSHKYVKDMDSAQAITTDFDAVRKKFLTWLASDFSSSGISEVINRLAHITLSDIIVSDYELTELTDDIHFAKIMFNKNLSRDSYARFLSILYIICTHKQVGTDYNKLKITFESEYTFLNNYTDSIKFRMSYLINHIIPYYEGNRTELFMSMLLIFIFDSTDISTIALLLVDLESKYQLDVNLRKSVKGSYKAIKACIDAEMIMDDELGSLGIYEDIFHYVKEAEKSETYAAFDAIKDGLNVIKEPTLQEKEVWNKIAEYSNILTIQSHPFLWGLTYGLGKDLFKHKERTVYAKESN